MATLIGFVVSPFPAMNSEIKLRCQVQARSLKAGASLSVDREKDDGSIEEGKGRLPSGVEEKKRETKFEELEALWDDGYGTQTVLDYFDATKDMNVSDGGPPRWFCPFQCGRPLKDSPTLLFLPGIDGTGLGLILHHKALGKAFEVRCMHIPVHDRTPIEGLVKFVEEAVQIEHALCPKKPIYLVGDSLGACLALAVAARNPTLDLVLILVNPGTSFSRSKLQPVLPILEACPDGFQLTVPFLLSFIMGDPVKMATVNMESKQLPPSNKIEQLSHNLPTLLPCLPELTKILPKDTLVWKLKLLKSAAAYANSRLHAVKAEVLMLARIEIDRILHSSGKDNMLPSGDEARRLASSLRKCKVRLFEEKGHTLLLEDGIGLLTIIKGTGMYRRSRSHDLAMDFIPPSMTEFNYATHQVAGFYRSVIGSVMFSTMENGKIVKGLGGVPDEGPVLFVGYHNLLGLEIFSIGEHFLREKGIMIRGISHNQLFSGLFESSASTFSLVDWLKVFGGVSVSGSNLYKLLSAKSHVLLYPGGAREALHFKGEKYKLIWPNRQEFVRIAAHFGATIVPFGAIGEDDIAEMVLDYNDLMKIPILNDFIRNSTRDVVKIRDESSGEVANQNLAIPLLLPKLPGRFYYVFGKPIRTKGKEKMLRDKGNAEQVYQQVKSEVERNLEYLIKKREEDPYRNLIDRKLYQNTYSSEPPAFKP
ncbi:acyltransferase-like protein [Senna tora]|uniref:Acyltransferase-like protein n=1 Tax=Senna tora TaxID=362788 RepID=A0A834T9D5_9FABA|nr:acyltransferase-like protein [Senna tora]